MRPRPPVWVTAQSPESVEATVRRGFNLLTGGFGVPIERMGEFLGIGLAGLITGLSPEVVVIVGEVTGAWDVVGPLVANVIKRRCLPHTTTRLVATDPALQPRLRGAATLVVQQHFGAPMVA